MMSGKVGDLSAKQAATLQEFRERLHDVLRPSHDDRYLLRWLRARSFDVKKSEKMLRENLKWRDQVGADNILSTWTCPEVLKQYYPGGLYGYDKQGHPIFIENAGCADFKGLLHSVRKTDIINLKIHACETIWAEFEKQSRKLGRHVEGLIIIADMENYGLKHIWKPAMDVYNEVLTMFESRYPETLTTCYIINAPRIFPVVYSLLKPFLSEETQKKCQILGRNWREKLLQNIDVDELPVHWGGTATDPDGDPKCRSRIGIGGDVPEKYYINRGVLDDLNNFTKTTIRKGSFFQIHTEVSIPGTLISWCFHTERHDIGFGLFRAPVGDATRLSVDKMIEILPIHRVNSHMVPEDGSFICAEAGIYLLYFDNRYSWVTSKKLAYTLETLPPETPPSASEADNNCQISNGNI